MSNRDDVNYVDELTNEDYIEQEPSYRNEVDIIKIGNGNGVTDNNLTSMCTGFNHRFAAIPLAKNRERSGLTFFTRPNLNLSEKNMLKSRKIARLYLSQPNSINSMIMAALDPYNRHLAYDSKNVLLGGRLKDGVPFQNDLPFIPFLTNLLESISGFPDSTLDVYRSNEGIRREQVSFVDSTYHINNAQTLSAAFRNIDGDPITKFFNLYLQYMSYIAEGVFWPRGYSLYANELDYNIRIIRFNMDPTNRYITKFGAGIASFPLNDNYGAAMNSQTSNPFITDNDQINIQFEVNGIEYDDPILLFEFNELVAMFNPDMKDIKSSNNPFLCKPDLRLMRKLLPSEVMFFNNRGYPYVDIETQELCWYVYHEMYDATVRYLAGTQRV